MMRLIPILLTLLITTSCFKKKEISGEKVLYQYVGAEIKGMDPIYSNDSYSSNQVAKVYEGLLQYHYLKRPYTLEPNLAESMPTVSKDGLTYTFKIRKGVLFHDNKCFPNGKGRELTADDFVFSIKRVADPKLISNGWWLLQGKIKGLDDWRKKYAKSDKVNYDEVVEGLKSLDKYTLQFKLSKPFPQFLYSLAMSFHFAVPKEAVEMYGKEFINHPVGTGPFLIKKFSSSLRSLVFEKNPTYREKKYPSDAAEPFKKQGLLKDAGKKLPLVDKVIVKIMTESQPMWLNFQKGKLDYVAIPKDNFDQAITPDKELTPEQKSKEILLHIEPSMDVSYMAFNHDHPLFKNNVKLRRAMSLAHNTDKARQLFQNGRGVRAHSVVPPGIAGHIKGYSNPFMGPNLEKAKKLLAEAGYPNGQGLPEITYDISSSTDARQAGEFFKKQMSQIGVNVKVVQNPWPVLQKKIKDRKIMMYGIAWLADYPDAENFLQLLYGPNKTPGANGSNYDNAEFNSLFKKASLLQDSPQRTSLYEKLYKLAAEEVPWIFGLHRESFALSQKWLRNFILSDFNYGFEQYLDVDTTLKEKLIEEKF